MKIDKLIKKSLNESINKLITEAFQSSKLRNFFKEHGGVNREYYQKSLGDISDEQIMYYSEFENYYDALNEQHRLIFKMRRDHHTRSQYDMACLFKVYVANDGCACLVGIDRNSIETRGTWSGEQEKKVADRFWRQKSNEPYDDTPKYHYSRRGYGPDFGLHTNDDYKNQIDNLAQKKELFGKWGKSYGNRNNDYNYNEWRGKELERAQEYIRNHPRYDGRDNKRLNILRNLDK